LLEQFALFSVVPLAPEVSSLPDRKFPQFEGLWVRDAAAMAQAVVQDVAQFGAGDQFDHITRIIAKRAGEA
jgi:hypothetical protein